MTPQNSHYFSKPKTIRKPVVVLPEPFPIEWGVVHRDPGVGPRLKGLTERTKIGTTKRLRNRTVKEVSQILQLSIAGPKRTILFFLRLFWIG